jgi:hypothetical protein
VLAPSIVYAVLAMASLHGQRESSEPYDELALLLRRSDAWHASLNFEGALALSAEIPEVLHCQTFGEVVRETVLYLTNVPGTAWHRLSIYGVDVVVQAIATDVDAIQCLAHSGLLDDSDEAHAFWNAVKAAARERINAQKSLLGYRGEELSFRFEERELTRLKIEREPIWVSRRDDTRGYDIQSFRIVAGRELHHYVEAKAHVGSYEFYISRREWSVALLHPRQYIFHLWHVPTETKVEISVASLEPLMPAEDESRIIIWDNVVVRWNNVTKAISVSRDGQRNEP